MGVIPEFMKSRELAYTEADELVTVATMRERKKLMEERASAFVVLPGGLGTLEEFFRNQAGPSAVSQPPQPAGRAFKRSGWVLRRPAGKYFARVASEGSMSPDVRDLFTVLKTADEVWQQLDQPVPFKPDAIWQMNNFPLLGRGALTAPTFCRGLLLPQADH